MLVFLRFIAVVFCRAREPAVLIETQPESSGCADLIAVNPWR